MKDLFRIRDFRLLWIGQAVSNFGDGLTNLALLLTAQRLTGSTAAVAGTAIAVALPTLLFGLLAGAYIDRWNRKRVMIVSDLFRTTFVLAFLLVTTADRMWILYTVAFIQAAFGTFFNPAKSAFVPKIVETERLLSANSVSQMTQIVFGLIGTALAGVIAATNDTLALAYLIDASTFLVSLVAIGLIRTNGAPDRRSAEVPSILSDVRVGIRVLAGSRALQAVLVGGGVLMFGIGSVNVLLVPFVVEDLAVSETWFAGFDAAQVIAMVMATSLVGALATKLKESSMVVGGLIGIGFSVGLMSLVTAPWHLVVLLFFAGWAIAPLQAAVSTISQQEVEDEYRGRTGAALNTVLTAANVGSMAIAGGAAAAISVRGVFVAAGGFALAAALVASMLFARAGVGPQTTEGVPAAAN